MTGQIPDEVLYQNKVYSIVGIKGEGFPDPLDYGFLPRSPHTANWRGYQMWYEIDTDQLSLQQMDVYVEKTKEKPARINDVKPVSKKWGGGIIHLSYQNLKYKTEFTGNLLVGSDFIDSMYVHMGFQSPISFESVIEFRVNKGDVVSIRDISKLIKDYRKKNKSDGKLKPTGNTMEWISRTFSLDYDF